MSCEASDTDGDGINDVDDSCPNGGTGTDTDGDGCTDSEDNNGDGVTDLDDLCRTSRGPATNDRCPYVCGLDEAGNGQEPCTPCGEGEAPNDDRTARVVCEHGESSPGRCEPDRCLNKPCGANGYCFRKVCHCNSGYEDPDKDDVCTKKCPTDSHDPDRDGVCTRVCSYEETDVVAKASLISIPGEPWEHGEHYECVNNAVEPKGRVSTEHDDNVCHIENWIIPSDAKAFGHSHPFFEWNPNLSATQNTVMCHGRPLNTKDKMEQMNRIGRYVSPGDQIRAKGEAKPFYLVVPQRDAVKVYRRPERCTDTSCPWAVFNL